MIPQRDEQTAHAGAKGDALLISRAGGRDNVGGERIKGEVFRVLCLLATLVGIVALGALLIYVFYDAWGWVDLQFLTDSPSRFPERAGLYPQLIGTIYVIALVALFSLPLGVGAAIYLEEYARDNWLKRLIQLNISNLAGVPSIVFGILGLGIFVTWMGMGHGIVILGAFVLTFRVLPILIVSAQEAIRAVPDSQRRGAYGLGATRWQVIRSVVLPESMGAILTGAIISLAQGMGETAPLIMIGAAQTIFRAPQDIFSPFASLPLQIFAWSDLPAQEFQHGVTPAGIVVLLVVLLLMNGTAIWMRHRFSRYK